MSSPSSPNHDAEIAARLRDAVMLHQRGQLIEAERIYRQILERVPAQFDALQLLGAVKIQHGQFAEGADLIRQALAINPRSPRALLNLGHALASLGRDDEAVGCFDRAVAEKPDYFQAHQGRGASLLRLGRPQDALTSFDAVLAVQPAYVDALGHRGVALAQLGRPADALTSLDRALAARPNDGRLLVNRGNVLRSLKRPEEALRCFDAALAQARDDPEILCSRGAALNELNRAAEALACYDRALAARPDMAEAHYSRGNALRGLEKFADAVASYDRALALRPDYFEALHGRGAALERLYRYGEAIQSYEQALAVSPNNPFTLSACAYCALSINDWTRAFAFKAELEAAIAKASAMVDPFVFVAFGDGPAAQLARTRRYAEELPANTLPPRARPADGDKIRIAYLSSDFRPHPTAHLIARVFELHDRRRFDVVGVTLSGDDGSAIRARIAKAFDRFIDVHAVTDAHAAAQLAELGIDICIDLNGYIASNRAGILAQRPAPVQVAWLGYPGTMGARFIDYVLGDRFVTPFDEQASFAERIVQLPDSYQPNDATREIAAQTPSRAQAGLPERGFVFCCFNNSFKIVPPVFDCWMRLLRAVDGSVLWLLQGDASARENLVAAARARGVDPARLVFAARAPLAEHLARHRLADLFLDTLPYNAHTTGSDALWAGLPMVTCVGDTFAGRVGASLLHAVGLPGLVTHNSEDYEALALRLAREPEALARLKARLASDRASLPLFDSARMTRHLEAAYTTMWERHRRDEPPRGFTVEAIAPA